MNINFQSRFSAQWNTPIKLDGIATSTNLERLNEGPQQNADRVTLPQQLDESRSSKQTQEPEVDDSTAAARLYNRQISHCARTCSLKPRLHDTTSCHTGCQTGLTTGLTTVLNEQLFVQPVVKPRCTTGLTTGLTTGCIVYTNILPGCQTGLTTGQPV